MAQSKPGNLCDVTTARFCDQLTFQMTMLLSCWMMKAPRGSRAAAEASLTGTATRCRGAAEHCGATRCIHLPLPGCARLLCQLNSCIQNDQNHVGLCDYPWVAVGASICLHMLDIVSCSCPLKISNAWELPGNGIHQSCCMH